MASKKSVFTLRKECKGSIQYECKAKDAISSSFYLNRSVLPDKGASPPSSITVTVQVSS
jgi:hypothetical protein